MEKTQNLRDLLTEYKRTRDLEPKMLEQKVFAIWKKQFGVPFGKKTVPVSFSDGVLKIYTEYPTHKNELSLLTPGIITHLNAELGQAVLTDLRVELRPIQEATPHPHHTKDDPTNSQTPNTPRADPTPEELDQVEQTVAGVTDTELKTSLRQLFITQSKEKP
jgi:hypothetical protein